MPSRPEPGAATARLSVADLIHGRWRAETVRALLRLDIPDRLGTGARSADDLAAELGARPDRLRRLLTLATRLGLLTDDGAGRFANGPIGALLRRDHPHSMRVEAAHALSNWTRIAWDGLDDAVRHGTSGFESASGRTVFEYLATHPDEAADFHAFQADVTRRNAAALAGFAFPSDGVVVDVGGGNGTLLAELLRDRPGLRGIVFDQPAALRDAAAALSGAMAARIDLMDGDFFDQVPAGADLYLLSHVLHDWSDKDATAILRRVADAMTSTSLLLVMENVRDEDGSNPLVAYLDVLMLTAWGSRERTAAEYAALFADAGLLLPTSVVMLEPRSQLTALTARIRPDMP